MCGVAWTMELMHALGRNPREAPKLLDGKDAEFEVSSTTGS